MTFNQFLAHDRTSDKIERDFILDAQSGDEKLPEFDCWKDLKEYLVCHPACPPAITAAKALWIRYQRTR